MKNIFTLIALTLIFSLHAERIPIENSKIDGYKILSNDTGSLIAEFGIGGFNYTVEKTEKGNFTSLNIDKGYLTRIEGSPALPALRHLIAMPYGSSPEIEVVSYETTKYKLSELGINYPILPAQPSYSKSSKPEERKFIYNESVYFSSKFNESPIASVSKSGTMRGVGIGSVVIEPFRYNPVSGEIILYNNVKVKVNFIGANSKSSEISREEYSPFFESAFSTLINYSPKELKADLISYPVTYLILANSNLNGNADLNRFVEWKTQKGFKVVTNFVSASSSVSTNDAWIENQYSTLSPKPSFVLIVGDHDGSYGVLSEVNPPLGSTGSVTRSDLLYGVIGATGSLNRIPSMYVGRMSVRSTAELTAQVDKTLWYEKDQFFVASPDLNYLTYSLGVAGVDSGFGASHGNPQISYGWTYYFNSANGMGNSLSYLYPASDGSSVPSAIVNYISNGANFYNYTAHGSNSSFADPYFGISNVDGLANANKYPLIVGNCCLTGSFGDVECFGESWLNAANKGAIGFIGASMSTYWDEDLAMGVGLAAVNQVPPPLDTEHPGMYDGAMALGYSSQAAIKHVGLMAVEALGTSYTDDYWSSYHLFGDPSLMVYFGVPGDNSVSHDPVITPGVTYFTVRAVKGSYVGITDDDGNLRGAAVSDEFGYAVVTIEPFIEGNAHITVTAQFKKPYIAVVPVEEMTNAYLVLNNSSVSKTDFGSTGTIDVELKNIGVLTSQGISVSASSLSEYITFSDSSELFPNIAASDSILINSAFSYTISSSVPDGTEIRIKMTISDFSKRTYPDSYIIFNAKAPNLSYTHSYDGNIINPGDIKSVTIRVNNSGTGTLSNITADFSETTGGSVTISGQQIIPSIAGGTYADIVFIVNFSTSIPNGTGLDFRLDLSADNSYDDSYEFELNVGMTENFETGDFSIIPWYFEGNSEWTIDNTVFHTGSYSSKSGYITDSQSTSMIIDFIFTQDGTISFYRKVSSESGYDKLTFYIDNISKGQWSGSQDWSYVSYSVVAGLHTFKWTYSKDASLATGLDCAWVDNILATNAYSGIEEELTTVPGKPALYQNYPNPFNPITTINFSIPEIQDVKLRVFNSNGQLVKDLISNKMERGLHSVSFNAESLNSGIYFYTLEIPGNKLTQKMLLIK